MTSIVYQFSFIVLPFPVANRRRERILELTVDISLLNLFQERQGRVTSARHHAIKIQHKIMDSLFGEFLVFAVPCR